MRVGVESDVIKPDEHDSAKRATRIPYNFTVCRVRLARIVVRRSTVLHILITAVDG